VKARVCIGLIVGGLLAAFASPGSASAAVSLQPVGTFAAPIFVTSPPGDPRLFVVERGGTIRVVKNGATLGTPFLDISALTTTVGERGLLSMAFDPNYATNGLFYVFFNDNGSAGATTGDIHVDEFRVSANADVADLASRRPVLTISHSAASNHNGGQLQFGKDGFLYVSVGEAAVGANAQTTANLLGKVLRIDPHGVTPGAHTSPADNPFAGATPGADEIWSLGLRNPFRFSFDHTTGDMVIGDVGQSAFEEVDYSPTGAGLGRGANYGWPTCEGFSGTNCGGPVFTPPVFDYPHTNPGGGQAFGCAIIGGYVYRGTQVPELAGRYLYADLCTAVLRSTLLGLPLASGDRSEVPIGASPNSFGEDANCELYVAAGSTVSRIVSTAPPAVAPACATALRSAITVRLKSNKRRVRRGHRVKLLAKATPCPLLAGNEVSLLRRGKKIRTKTLAPDCTAAFRVRIKKQGRFKARVSETAQHLGDTSDPLKVKIKH
jgi:glucose/arabinose dehydrogenase